jgi:hypothetical protein
VIVASIEIPAIIPAFLLSFGANCHDPEKSGRVAATREAASRDAANIIRSFFIQSSENHADRSEAGAHTYVITSARGRDHGVDHRFCVGGRALPALGLDELPEATPDRKLATASLSKCHDVRASHLDQELIGVSKRRLAS